MEAKDKIAVVQKQIEVVYKEIQGRMETGKRLWQVVIGGLAAVVVLKKDVDLALYFPVVPLIGMLLLAYWLREFEFLFRSGRMIATMESIINRLAGGPDLLFCETKLRKERQERLGKGWYYVAGAMLIIALWGWFFWWLLHRYTAPQVPGFAWIIALASVLTLLYILMHVRSTYYELRKAP